MKSGPKKGAFENSVTGYGRHRYNSNPSHKNSNKSSAKNDLNTKKVNDPANDKKPTEENDADLNSGFGTYLRSTEGVEMMKLFIFANSVMLILTMGWPHFKEMYIMFMQWWDSYSYEAL